MKRVLQKTTTDCASACLASLLEVPLKTVPRFWKRTDTVARFYAKIQRWLVKHHGLNLVTIVRPAGVSLRDMFCNWRHPAKFIVTVPVPGGFHSVVACVSKNGARLTHDPGSWDKGVINLREATDFSFLVPNFRRGTPWRHSTKE